MKTFSSQCIVDDKDAWDYIQNGVKFNLIKEKLKGTHPHWSSRHINLAIQSYQIFLYIVRIYPKSRHSPHASLDEVWHTHILFTQEYFSDCNKIFGYYLHHFPASPYKKRTKKENEKLKNAYLNTRRQSVLVFGDKADPEVLFKPVANEVINEKSKKNLK